MEVFGAYTRGSVALSPLSWQWRTWGSSSPPSGCGISSPGLTASPSPGTQYQDHCKLLILRSLQLSVWGECELVGMYLLEHLQREGPVFGQTLTLLGCLQAELAGLVLQSGHLLLNEPTQKGFNL